MNRTELIGLVIFTTFAAAIDGLFLVARCASSPPLHVTGVAVGLTLQLAAVAMPLVTHRILADESLKVRLRMFAVGLFACVLSMPIMETALLFGDSIGKGKGFPSAGHSCEHSRWFPD